MNSTESKRLPELTLISIGNEYKVYSVTGDIDDKMLPHISTEEAVIIILDGNAMLEIKNMQNHLKEGAVFIIPAKAIHSLEIKSKF